MEAPSLNDDFILFDPDYISGMRSSFLPYTFQLDATAHNHDKNFNLRFKQIYDYLDQLLNSNDTFISPIFNQETFPIVRNAKQIYRETSLQIIDAIKGSFEQDYRYQFLPDTLIQQTMENLRQHLFIGYNKMMQNVANLAQSQPTRQPAAIKIDDESNMQEVQPRQKLKPGKTKFPKKARQVLEHWYKTHNDDPFPSYTEKARLAEEGGISIKQVKCWFINVRRKWKQELNKDDEDFKAQIERKLVFLNKGGAVPALNPIHVAPQGYW